MKPVPPAEPEIDTITMEEAIVLENILYDFVKKAQSTNVHLAGWDSKLISFEKFKNAYPLK